MDTEVKEVTISGITYVPKSDAQEMAKINTDGLPYVIIRGKDSGAFAGYLKGKSENCKVVELVDSRRLWYWDGAFTLSSLAQEGLSRPENCKFPCIEFKKIIPDTIEIIYCTEKARLSIEGVKVWMK